MAAAGLQAGRVGVPAGLTVLKLEATRRRVLRALGAAVGAAAVGAWRPPGARAQAPALGVHESVAEALRRVFGARPLRDGEGAVVLEAPAIAENGAVVPIAVEVASPTTPAAPVRHIWIVADRNRIPIIARATLTPESGPAYLAVTVRLGETGDVRAIVERSDGTLLQVKREVRVTVGGCGG